MAASFTVRIPALTAPRGSDVGSPRPCRWALCAPGSLLPPAPLASMAVVINSVSLSRAP